MIDYTDKPAKQEFPTEDDVKAFGRFLYNASAGAFRLSDEGARDAIGVCGVLSKADAEHFAAQAGEDGAVFRRALDVADAALRVLASQIGSTVIKSRDQADQLRSIATLAAADIPAVDVVYAIRRVLAGGGE